MFTIGGTSNRGFYSFEPNGSLRFEDGDTARLQRTPTTSGNRKTWTFSCWFKRANISLSSIPTLFSVNDSAAGLYNTVNFQSNDTMYLQVTDGSSAFAKQTNRVFRDTSAWYHLVWSVDTTQSTAADRVKVYINGVEETSFSTNGTPGQNAVTDVNHTLQHQIGNFVDYTRYFDGYMAEIYLIDGTAHDADTFGETKSGVWLPKDAKGSLTFGTNGFYLPFNSTVTAEGQSTVLYEGTAAQRSVEGFGYKPDFLWLKNRDDVADHRLFDRVRGPSSQLESSGTTAETLRSNMVHSFNSDGFTVGTANSVNGSGDGMVAWAWDAGADQTPTGFGCVTYTGSGGRRPVRDVGFTPGLVWIKARSSTGFDHVLQDSVRGPTKQLYSNSTSAEVDDTDAVVSLDNDGFTTGADVTTNNSGTDFVAWCWDAGDGDAVSNTDGDITSTVKASDTHGFSIVEYTGTGANATIGHGLSSTPSFVLYKRTSATENWGAYHTSTGNTGCCFLNLTGSKFTDSNYFNDTSPTSTTLSVGTNNAFNGSGSTYIAYCWTEKSGYSKFGSYTGNGSATGPTVTLGFRPAFVMRKRTDAASDWVILDTTRDNFNNADTVLSANKTNADTTVTADAIEITSTGFQVKGTGAGTNANGGTYIYMAFAGGIDTIAPVNTDGDIDSRVKASDDTGFSIVRYEGSGTADDGVGHGLSSTPDVVFCKRLDATSFWRVQAYSTLGAKYLDLNSTGAADSAQYNQVWGATAPTSSVIHVGGSADVTQTNASGGDYIMYCWTATTGKSAFGSYTGTGAAGNSITGLGFEPAFLIIKRTSAAEDWAIYDSYRSPNNTRNKLLSANTSDAESTPSANVVDFDSDGFTLQGSGNTVNTNNETYIYMAFADGRDASFFHDESGQDNNFEPENVQNYDVVPDSPTNNFATLNPLQKIAGTLSEGNLEYDGDNSVGSTIAVSSGKWYCEARADSFSSDQFHIGFFNVDGAAFTASNVRGASSSSFVMKSNGQKRTGGTSSSYGSSFGTSDIIGMALDLDGGTLEFFINGTSQGDAFTSLSGNFVLEVGGPGASIGATFNFGQDDSFAGTVTPGGYTDANERGSFKYPVPDGFLSLCTANLPEPDISPAAGEQPEDYFNTVLYTGNSTSGHAITGVGFQPDFVWTKGRSNADTHYIHDVVRTVSNRLNPSATTEERSGLLSSFDSDGFTISSTGTGNNGTGRTYVAWNWLAGGTAVSNTDGSITSSVSANTKAGFSIVSYTGNGTTGATVGHGLDSQPEMVAAKNRDDPDNWWVWHTGLSGDSYYLHFDTTGAEVSNSAGFSAFSSTVVTLGNAGHTNGNGEDLIMYAFHSVEGYSKVGSYTGNGSSDGVFVHCGFRPAWIMIKRTDSTTNWLVRDVKRDTGNESVTPLAPNLSAAESSFSATLNETDILSNGFKLRDTYADQNASGATYIFIAFAEQPFKYAQAR